MLSCSIWFSALSFWMGGGLESRGVGCVDGAVRGSCVGCGWCCAQHHLRTLHTTHAAALKTTNHPKTRCRKPYAATQHLMLLMMGVCARNMLS